MERTIIVSRILESLPGAAVEIAGEDCSFSLEITWQGFASQRLLQRQQGVLRLFDAELGSGELHALTIVAKTPDERSRDLVQLQG